MPRIQQSQYYAQLGMHRNRLYGLVYIFGMNVCCLKLTASGVPRWNSFFVAASYMSLETIPCWYNIVIIWFESLHLSAGHIPYETQFHRKLTAWESTCVEVTSAGYRPVAMV